MQLSQHIGKHDVLLDCDRRFEEAGYSVLRKLAELDRQGPALDDGSRVQFGWSVLTLCSEGAGLRAYEPDYFGDALRALSPTVDTTLEVMTEQVGMLHRESVQGLDARFDHYVLAWQGALDAAEIFLRRRKPERPDDTGWFVGDLARLEEGPGQGLEALYVFEVLKRRRDVMKVLALPPGFAIVMCGSEISSIMRVEGEHGAALRKD
jgi:hypothetical protein